MKEVTTLWDHQIFSLQRHGGVIRYFAELCGNFSVDLRLRIPIVYSESDDFVHCIPRSWQCISAFSKKIGGRCGYLLANEMKKVNESRSLQEVRRGQFDIMHPTHTSVYFMNDIGNKPFVTTVYDMIHEIGPNGYPHDPIKTENIRVLMERARKIIAISANTKTDILKFYPHIPNDKIDVILLGANEPKHTIASGERLTLPGRYILFVGERRYYKNFNLFLESVGDLLRTDKDLHLVCVGQPFTEVEQALISSLGIIEKVLLRQVIDYGTLCRVYAQAVCFIFPSTYEGFGMPILEAMGCGCPVVLSNTSCFPEIADSAGEYFDPNDKASICEAVERVVRDSARRKELTMRGQRRARCFTWRQTGERTEALYRSVL